jgi:hypothetical protein
MKKGGTGYKVVVLKFAVPADEAERYMGEFVDRNPTAQEAPHILLCELREPNRGERREIARRDGEAWGERP